MITNLAGWTYAGTEAGLPVFYAETEADVEELRKKWGNRAIIRLSPTLYERYRVQEVKAPPTPPSPLPEAEVPPHPEVKKAIKIIKRRIIEKKPPVPPPAPTPVKPPIFKYLLLASLLVGGLGIILYLKKKK